MTLNELIHQVEENRPRGTSLDRLAEASAISRRLADLGDHLVGHFVDEARRDGATWARIGQSLGVSKQAAQQRFVAGEPATDLFTNRATVAVLKAQNAARDRGHPEVTGLHLLLGLLVEWDGLAGRALEAGGVTNEALAGATEAALPAAGTPTLEHAPLSGGLKKVLGLANREALRLGHGFVGTEHLLLALLEARGEPAAVVLTDLGVSKTDAEARTVAVLADLGIASRDDG